MSTTNVPNCATCGYDPKDDDPVMGYEDFRGGAVFHAECLANALHEALAEAQGERDEARALLREGLDYYPCDSGDPGNWPGRVRQALKLEAHS